GQWLVRLCLFLFLYSYRGLRDLHSFPTRRSSDLGRVTLFRGEWIESTSTHGTGCTLSAAIAACLGRGLSLEEAIETAKRFVARRSEEHTSELQSQSNLVCRLLLEKKKKTQNNTNQ